MRAGVKKSQPALKHGGYSATTILPGESVAEFEKLHCDLVAELTPNGVLERDTVATIARLFWRKQNLATFRIAELARRHREQLIKENLPPGVRTVQVFIGGIDPDSREEATRATEDQARKDLRDTYELVEIGDAATVARLMEDLDVQDRLDAMIDKCLKRLLFVRGLKSISSGSSPAPLKPLCLTLESGTSSGSSPAPSKPPAGPSRAA
jgi:hypothetical protein